MNDELARVDAQTLAVAPAPLWQIREAVEASVAQLQVTPSLSVAAAVELVCDQQGLPVAHDRRIVRLAVLRRLVGGGR